MAGEWLPLFASRCVGGMRVNEVEKDVCLECGVEIVDGGSWGYCVPCGNEVFDKLIQDKLKGNDDE